MERRVCTRFEVSGLNLGLRNYAYFISKLYLDSRGACSGGELTKIFFFFFILLFLSFFYFLFLKIDLQGHVDEDITHLETNNNPPLNIQGPITRARARQLNLEVS
jgi:hypothetical protein